MAAGRWWRRSWRRWRSWTGLRPAEPGEFTRRAFENGRIDLAEAEGLADLLAAETQSQRRAALAMAGGSLSRQVEAWRQRLLALAAALEAALDFSDEGEVGEAWPPGWAERRGSAGRRTWRPCSAGRRRSGCGTASESSSRARRTLESPAFSTP